MNLLPRAPGDLRPTGALSDGYQALRLLLRAQESCTVGPVFLWGHHLVCGSSWPSAQPAHGALAPPLAVGGRTESVSRGHVGDTAVGVLSACFTEPLPGPLRPPQGCLPHAGLAERGTASGSRCPSRPLGLSLCNVLPRCRCHGVGGLWATRGSVPTGLCPGSVVTSRTARAMPLWSLPVSPSVAVGVAHGCVG